MQEQSIDSINLDPIPGKVYYNSPRPWQEEIIYFLLIDRFHDGKDRSIIDGSAFKNGYGAIDELNKSCGGTINGIRKNLNYIQNLGCTSIWLSPFLKNNPESYHGYAIENFLEVDHRFGSKEDLVLLIAEAHQRNMKVFFDCVINHTGNNWMYEEGEECWYDTKKKYHFGEWRRPDIPIPFELRNPTCYQKKGMIRNWDKYPETIEGDFFSLKKLDHSETPEGQCVQEILFRIYAYWIKETDCDGFRMDAAKHVGELALRNFVTRIKTYTKNLGKEQFFVFAEIPEDDKLLQKFMSPCPEVQGENLQSIDTVLDFPLHFKLPKVVSGKANEKIIFDRYSSIKKNLAPLTSEPFLTITFLDNHDQIESPVKERIAFQLGPNKIVNALRLLFTLPGVPCLYYGTEQGLQGHGERDECIREMMFDPYSDRSILDPGSILYEEIQHLAALRERFPALIYGELGKVQISQGMGGEQDLPVIGYSRKWKGEELIFLCNLSDNETRLISVKKDKMDKQKLNDETLNLVYGGEGTIQPNVVQKNYSLFQVKIPPAQFLILK